MFSMSYWRSRCPICPIRGLMIYIKCKYTDMSEMSDYLPDLWITPPLCPQLVHNCGYPVDNYICRNLSNICSNVDISFYLLVDCRLIDLLIVDLSLYRYTNPIPLWVSTMSYFVLYSPYNLFTFNSPMIHLPFTLNSPSVHLVRALFGYQVERTGCSE